MPERSIRSSLTRSAPTRPAPRPIGVIFALNAWSLLLAGVALAILGPIVLGSIADTAAKQGIKPTGIAQPFLTHPMLVILVAAPAIIGGLWAAHRLPGRWLALTVAAMSAIAGVGVMLAALLALLTPLYEMPKL